VLPRWRGAAPIERALMSGDTVTGVTIFQITAGLDSGPTALVRHEPIRPADNAGTLSARLAAIGAELLVEALDMSEAGALELSEQPEDGVTYADKIDPGERRLDVRRPAADLERVVRALTPAIGAYLELEDSERLGVEESRVADAELPAGSLAATDGRLLLGCGEDALELVRVKPPGGRGMTAADFLRGHHVPERVAVRDSSPR
jgi:methionyl-tRNA formyltransferase